jgi:hypothetical protein
MSGGRRRYQPNRSTRVLPAVGRPLDGRVRRLMEHGLVACHEREFATLEVRETRCLEANEPNNERTPSRSSNDTEAGKARAAGWCRSRRANTARRCAPRTADEPSPVARRRCLETQPRCLNATREHSTEQSLGEAGNERHETHPFAWRRGSPLAAGRTAGSNDGELPRP